MARSGTALLNTLYAGAVTGYLADNLGDPADAGDWRLGVDPRLPRRVLLGRRTTASTVVSSLLPTLPLR